MSDEISSKAEGPSENNHTPNDLSTNDGSRSYRQHGWESIDEGIDYQNQACLTLDQQIALFDEAWPSGKMPVQLGRGHIPQYETSQRMWNQIHWYHKSTTLQKDLLQNFLIQLDRQNRVDLDDSRTHDIHNGVNEIMKSLVEELEQLDNRFTGELHKVGSSHNQTKIGLPDEFDFIYQLDICNLLSDETASLTFDGRALHVKSSGCYGKCELFDCTEVLSLPPKVGTTMRLRLAFYKDAITKYEEYHSLNCEHVAFAFFLLVNRALRQLVLPEGWSHGGFDKPRFSGVRIHFPSFLVQLHYDGKGFWEPQDIAVDFVPVFNIESISNTEKGILEDHLARYVEKPWIRLTHCYHGPILTNAEERFLSDFPQDSVPKTVIRICKALHNEALLSTPAYLTKTTAEQVANYRSSQDQNDPGEKSIMWPFRFYLSMHQLEKSRHPDNVFATVQDIGETMKDFEYVQSYVFKLAVLTLMVLDPQKGTSWTEHDITELVLSVYMIISDVIVSDKFVFDPVNGHIAPCLGEELVPLRYSKKDCRKTKQTSVKRRHRQPADGTKTTEGEGQDMPSLKLHESVVSNEKDRIPYPPNLAVAKHCDRVEIYEEPPPYPPKLTFKKQYQKVTMKEEPQNPHCQTLFLTKQFDMVTTQDVNQNLHLSFSNDCNATNTRYKSCKSHSPCLSHVDEGLDHHPQHPPIIEQCDTNTTETKEDKAKLRNSSSEITGDPERTQNGDPHAHPSNHSHTKFCDTGTTEDDDQLRGASNHSSQEKPGTVWKQQDETAPQPPKLYCRFREALQEGKCSKFDSLLSSLYYLCSPRHPETGQDLRLWQVFELLRNVAEGKSHALITLWSDEYNERMRKEVIRGLITKDALRILLSE